MVSIYSVLHQSNIIGLSDFDLQFTQKGKVRALKLYTNTKGVRYVVYNGKRYSV